MSSHDEIMELSEISSTHSNVRKPSAIWHQSPHLHESVSNATSVSEEITFTKSEVHSYRDRLKERFNSLKKKAGKSAANDRISLLKTSVRLLQKDRTEGVERDILAGSNKRERSDDFEEYIFFCEEGDNAPQQKQTEDEEWDGSKLFRFRLPEQLHYVAELQEQNLLWQPKRISTVFNQQEVLNCIMEEDGLYIANRPDISRRELILLQQRLGADECIKWFDRDASLKTLETPYANFSLRPSTKPLHLTEYCPATTKPFFPCEEVVVHRSGILDLQISSLTFKHHPLFSAEHVLQQRLIEFYDIYQQMSSQNVLQRLSSRLEALRNSKVRLEKEAGDAVNADTVKEIAKLRNRLFEEGKRERDALKGLLQTWKTIKQLRESTGYSSTSIKLTIRKESVEYSREKEAFESQIEETISEIILERSKEYQDKMTIYKEELQVWKSSTNREVVQKPKKPQKDFNNVAIKQEILSKFDESLKPPGEPKLHFEINYDNEITMDVQDANEKLRRNCVKTTKIWLKIFCNDIEVCKTKHVLLNDKFTCIFEENYSIQLSGKMANIMVEIIEQPGALLKRKIGELVLPVASENENSQLREQHFLKEEIIHYNKHGGVGSGIAFSEIISDSNLPDYVLNTSGFVLYSSRWDFSEKPVDFIQSDNNLKYFDEIFDKNGMIDAEKLVMWAENRNLDPEDPRNTVVCEYVKTYADATHQANNKNFFRLNHLLRDLIFCDHTEIERNIRLIILQHRNNNVPEFSGMVVPNRLKEIPFNVLQNYLQRLNDLKQDFSYTPEDNVELKRSRARKFLKQVFMNIFQQCRNSEDSICFEDVVDEKYLAHFDLLVQTVCRKLISFFRLQPKGENIERSTVTRSNIEKEESEIRNATVKLVVHLQSGLNVPCRKNDEEGVRPFVVIECGGVEVVSSSADGANCSWNEELILPLETTHTDYLNPDSLNGFVTINLFDDVSKETKQTIFLGNIDVPISAICSSQIMEGFFKIKIPHLLPNYVQYHEKLLSASTASNIQHIPAQETYLLFKIHSTPPLPKLSPSMLEWPSNETPYIQNHILQWNASYNSSYPSKKFSALVINTNGKSSCVTRYIRPLEPPQLNPEGFDVTPEQCARYVSMIPFTECNKFYENVCLTTDQLLKLMVGSVLDHAIALTCHMLSLNVEAWLLLGFGIPNGTTAYVLVREYIKEVPAPVHYIFDVVSGTKYSLFDVYCPLQRIFCVVNDYNIWANLQRADRIGNIRFDLNRKFDWSPLFDNQIQAPTNTVQTKLNYHYEDHVADLEVRIDKKIKKKVIKMRKLQRTVWNHSVAKAYRSIMRRLEFNSLHGKSSRDVYLEVNRIVGSVEVNGYMFNAPYTKVSTMVKQVLKCVEHLVETDSVEFAVTVYVHPYPACVYSTWIFFASIK